MHQATGGRARLGQRWANTLTYNKHTYYYGQISLIDSLHIVWTVVL